MRTLRLGGGKEGLDIELLLVSESSKNWGPEVPTPNDLTLLSYFLSLQHMSNM